MPQIISGVKFLHVGDGGSFEHVLSAISNSVQSTTHPSWGEPGMGTLRSGKELFRSEGAQLFLLDGDESELMQTGDFVVMLVRHVSSFLAAVVAMVGDMQWPVGKDSVVQRLGAGRFSFTLPANLKYGLALDNHPGAGFKTLEIILENYATYINNIDDPVVGANGEQITFLHWSTLAKESEPQSGSHFQTKLAVEKMSQPMAHKMQQARRMSAVAKLFSKGVEKGAINVSTHVKLAGSLPPDSMDLVMASVDAVAKVVEAVETEGKTLFENAQVAGTDWVHGKYGREHGETAVEGLQVAGRLLNSAWTLNKVGLCMLFRTIASIHRGRSGSVNAQMSASSSYTSHMHQSPLASSMNSSYSSRSPVFSSSMCRDSNDLHSGGLKVASGQPSRVDVLPRGAPSSMPPPPPPVSLHPPSFSSCPPSMDTVAESYSRSPFHLYKPQPRSVVATLSCPAKFPSHGRAPRPHQPPTNQDNTL